MTNNVLAAKLLSISSTRGKYLWGNPGVRLQRFSSARFDSSNGKLVDRLIYGLPDEVIRRSVRRGDGLVTTSWLRKVFVPR